MGGCISEHACHLCSRLATFSILRFMMMMMKWIWVTLGYWVTYLCTNGVCSSPRVCSRDERPLGRTAEALLLGANALGINWFFLWIILNVCVSSYIGISYRRHPEYIYICTWAGMAQKLAPLCVTGSVCSGLFSGLLGVLCLQRDGPCPPDGAEEVRAASELSYCQCQGTTWAGPPSPTATAREVPSLVDLDTWPVQIPHLADL